MRHQLWSGLILGRELTVEMRQYMDLEFLAKYAPLYAEAAKLTISIGLLGIFFSLLVGFVCSMVGYMKIPILRQVAAAYIELSRNTPLLVQLFFLYFGLPKAGIRLEAETCAVVGLTFLGGSYMAEAFRSGLESVDKGQHESALALGLNGWQTYLYIIIPQAFSVSVPAFCANMIFLIKETSVFSVLALPDLMYVAKDLIGLYYKTDEALFMLVIAYLLLLLPISIIASVVERRVRYAGFGN